MAIHSGSFRKLISEKKMKMVISLSAALFLLSACASNTNSSLPVSEENFVTHVTESGAKQFSYSLKFEVNERGGRGSGKGMGRGQGRGMGRGGMPNKQDLQERIAERKAKAEERLMARLEDKLAENQYCANGFDIIDQYFGRGVMQVKGECN